MGVFDDPRAERVWYATLTPYDPALHAERTVRVASRGVMTSPADTPANTWFPGVLDQALRFERSMWSPGRIGGRALPDRGRLEVVNTGGFDAWLSWHWEGRSVEVRVGLAGAPFADAELLFTGTCGDLECDRNRLYVPVRDKAETLDDKLQEALYSGAGGADGGDDLKDKPKPIVLGAVKHITLVEVDPDTRLFQAHAGAIEAVDAVYENGASKATPAYYTASLAAGTITLAGAPAGLVTADVRGSKTGGTYVATAADLAERIVTEYGELTAGDLDADSFDALNVKTSAVLGLYTALAEVNRLDALDQVMGTVGGFYGFNRQGKFQVGRLDAPIGSPVLTLREADVVAGSVTRTPFGPPRWRSRIQWGRNFTLQLPDALDAAATDEYRTFAAQEFRTAAAEDETIKQDGEGNGGHKAAVDPDPEPTLFQVQADAEAEATRRLALFSVPRRLFSLETKTKLFTLDLGQEVRLVHSRFGIAGGFDGIVVGIREDAKANTVGLDLWG